MSVIQLKAKAVQTAYNGTADEYNAVLDKLQRRMSEQEFFDFCSRIFGEA